MSIGAISFPQQKSSHNHQTIRAKPMEVSSVESDRMELDEMKHSDEVESIPALSPGRPKRSPAKGNRPNLRSPTISGVKRKLSMDDPNDDPAYAASRATNGEHIQAAAPSAVQPVASLSQQSYSTHSHSRSRSKSNKSSSKSSRSRKAKRCKVADGKFFASFDQLHSQLEEDVDETMEAGDQASLSLQPSEPASVEVSMEDVQMADSATVVSAASSMPPLDRPADEQHGAETSAAAAVGEDVFPPPLKALDTAISATALDPLPAPLADPLLLRADSPPASLPPLDRAKTSNFPRAASPPPSATRSSRSAPNSPAKQPEDDRKAPVNPATMFSDMRIVLLEGSELTSKRCTLLTLQVSRRGGQVSSVAGMELPAKMRHVTHVLVGKAADLDGHVREYARFLQSTLKPRQFDSVIWASVEWLTACLRKNKLTSVDKFRLERPWLSPPPPVAPWSAKYLGLPTPDSGLAPDAMTNPNNLMYPPPAASSSYPPSYAQSTQPATNEVSQPNDSLMRRSSLPLNSVASDAAITSAATRPKRDIKYVLETMERAQAHASQPPANPVPQSFYAASSSSVAAASSKHSPAKSVNAEVPVTITNGILDASALRAAKRVYKGMPWAERAGLSLPPEPRGGAATGRTDAAAIPKPDSVSPPAPLTEALAQSYTQSVPTFTATVPYDPRAYLPRSSASYLNPDLPGDPHASFMQPTLGVEDDGMQHEENETMRDDTESASTSSAAAAPGAADATQLPVANYHPLPAAKKAGKWIDQNKAQLACQMFSSQHRNLNAHLTGLLEKLENMNGSIGDKWRTYAYRKAVGILKKYPSRISTQEDVLKLGGIRGLGTKILKKISEIIATGQLQKVNKMEQNEQIKTMELFSKIHGVGAATATKLYTWGCRNVEDLINDPRVELNAVQKVGLQFMEDKAQRIPRLEVTSILDYVQRVANRLLPGVTVICCGSFRRGAPTSGDVDLLFTHPTFTTRNMSNEQEDPDSVKQREGFLKKLLAILHEPLIEGTPRWEEEKAWCENKYRAVKEECDRIKQELARAKEQERGVTSGGSSLDSVTEAPPAASSSTSPPAIVRKSHPALRPPDRKSFITGDLTTFEKLSSRHGSAYFMGFCSLPKFHPFYSGVHRRMDMKVYPASHFPFALLYFTGSDHFNRSMRFYAKKKMWTLSDHGLAPAIRVNGDKVWSGKSVYCATEKDIFDALGLMYVPPEQRNVYSHFERTEEEIRMMRHNNTLQGDGGRMTEDELDDSHDAIREISPPPAAAASSSSHRPSSSELNPLGFPIKQEVKLELEEMDEVARAAIGLRRLAEEEAEILRNQLANLDGSIMNKQI